VAHCSEYHQHDFDLGPLAHLLPALPIYSFGQQLAALGLSDGLYQAHTGDQFVTYANAYQVVDMESYALAAVAAAHEIAFTAFKYITDGTNDDSAMDWIKAVKHVENRLHAAVMEWLGQF
jgi:adenosylhomocysteine nucleosidase